MEINSLNNLSDLVSVFSNPDVMKSVKEVSKSDKSGKYDSLLENLEKLSSILNSSDNGSVSSANSNLSAPVDTNNLTPAQQSALALQLNEIKGKGLDNVINGLIADANLLSELLDLSVSPPTEGLSSLLEKFREIIGRLDEASREIAKKRRDTEDQSQLKLRPSADTESGFAQGLTILAK